MSAFGWTNSSGTYPPAISDGGRRPGKLNRPSESQCQRARELLEQGVSPRDVAFSVGLTYGKAYLIKTQIEKEKANATP